MQHRDPAATDTNPANGIAGLLRNEGRKPKLLPDGTHVYPVVDASIPAYGVNGSGTGEITWHPERGLRLRVEAACSPTASGIEATLDQFKRPAAPSRGAGTVFEPSRDAELEARVEGTGEAIRVYQLSVSVNTQSESGTAGDSARIIVDGVALAATVVIRCESELSYWHESQGPCRLLMPDVCIYHWPTQDYAKWSSGDSQHSSQRCSCPLSDSPTLTLFSASVLPNNRSACWLVFEPELIPHGEGHWYTPDVCLAAKSMLSFLCGKRLPFLWTDRFLDENHVTRTYFGTSKVDDVPREYLGYQPTPLHSLEYGRDVVEGLPALFAAYLTLREWFDLEWIVGPLWYAIKAALDDRLGLASVALERFASAHEAFLEANPERKRVKVKFLTKPQSKVLRAELSDAVQAFSQEKGIDLTTRRSTAVTEILDAAVNSIAQLDDSLFSADNVEALRTAMKEAVARADASGKMKLDEDKTSIISRRIDSFAEKTNSDKLTEALEFDGLSVSDQELDAVMKRNDCLHGRRTLENPNSLELIQREVDRFDTLRTLINKAVLARLGYRGMYVDYSARTSSRHFQINRLDSELMPVVPEE